VKYEKYLLKSKEVSSDLMSTQPIIKEETQVSLTIVLTAIAIALADDIIVAFSSSIPWITDPNVHALVMATILTALSLVAIVVAVKKQGVDFSKIKMIFIPIGIFYFAFLFDRFVLQTIKNMSLTPLILSIGPTTFQVAQTMFYSSVVLIVMDIVLIFLVIKFVRE
jgi:hypothetical protein